MKFEEGKSYTTRSICDHDCIITVTVKKRTPKTLVADVSGDGEKRMRIQEFEGVEFVYPWGSGYSMCPVVRAE